MIDTFSIRSKLIDLALSGNLTDQRDCEQVIIEHVTNRKCPEIKPEDIVFLIPLNWKYARVCEIAEINPKIQLDDNTLVSFIPMTCVQGGFGNSHSEETKVWREIKKGFNHLAEGDIGVAKITPCFQNRKSVIYTNLLNGYGAASTELVTVRANEEYVVNKYLLYFFQSDSFIKNGVESFTGVVGQQRIHKDYLKWCVVPIPPVEEQRRIIKLLDSAFDELDRIDALQSQYATDLDAIKSKIIDAGIQGKLTEHLPEDEDVEELFAQIQAEKIEILRTRQGRADKNIKEDDENYLFEIKDNWKWIKFAEVGLFKKGPFGSALTKSMFVPKSEDTVKVYEQQHAIQKDETLGRYYITRQYFEDKMSGFEVLPGDIIISCAGTIGETYIMPDNIEQGIINQALMRITLVPSIDKKYFLYYFDSNLKASAQKQSNGMAIKNIPPFDVMKNWYFPLPPLAEQKRIVETIESIMRLLG